MVSSEVRPRPREMGQCGGRSVCRGGSIRPVRADRCPVGDRMKKGPRRDRHGPQKSWECGSDYRRDRRRDMPIPASTSAVAAPGVGTGPKAKPTTF